MKTKKVLIITYYRSENYGAFLQAFALQEFLRNHSIEAKIYEYKSISSMLLKLAFTILKKDSTYSENKKEYREQIKDQIYRQQIKLIKTKKTGNYDLTVLGSDEIWNVKNLCAAHASFLFCKNKKSKRTVSYAACSGNSKLKHLKLFYYAIPGILSLDAVAVRDEPTYNLMIDIGRKDAVQVLDPTFLINFDNYVSTAPSEIPPYLFVYSYNLSKEQIYEIRKAADTHKLSIIVTGMYCDWADYNPVPDPFDWIVYIKNAHAVVTTTFHGTVFAIQQHKTFGVYNSESPKIHSLLKELKLLDRRITPWNTLDMLLDKTIDYGKIKPLVNEKKKLSQQYLLNQLEEAPITYNAVPSYQKKVCYAARHKSDKVRWESRSGGVFTALSDVILEKKGIVYGVTLNEQFEAVHSRAETKEERDTMRGSKYVQSNMTNVLIPLLEDLRTGKTVMFTGTSCQTDSVRKLASVKHCEKNLITVDFVCHGVPSPLIWKEYLSLYPFVTKVDFRDKKTYGWADHQETITSNKKEVHSNIFTKLYHKNLITRPCCHECPYAQYKRFSDITIGDCWGIEKAVPGFNSDDSGVSMIMANTDNGQKLVQEALHHLDVKELTLSEIHQPVLKSDGMGTSVPSKKRLAFWSDYREHGIRYVCKHYSTGNKKDQWKRRLRLPYSIRFLIKKLLGKI